MLVNYVEGKSNNYTNFKYVTRKELRPGTKDKKKFDAIHGLTVQAVAKRGLPYGDERARKGYLRRCRREVHRRFKHEYRFLSGGIGELIIGAFVTTLVSMLLQYLIPQIIDWLEGELADLKTGDQKAELESLKVIAQKIDLEPIQP